MVISKMVISKKHISKKPISANGNIPKGKFFKQENTHNGDIPK